MAAEASVGVSRSYARYETQGLLQIVYTMPFPENRSTWRITPAFADTEPLEARFVFDLREPRP